MRRKRGLIRIKIDTVTLGIAGRRVLFWKGDHMNEKPEVKRIDGGKVWEKEFEKFFAKVFVPDCDLYTDVINYGFQTPYLMVFEETKQSMEDAVAFAKKSGLAKIAEGFGGSVVFFYPTCEGGWENAPADLFESIIDESRISQYYEDGTAIMWDRFNKTWGARYIRGAVLRTCVYSFGKSADYAAKNLLKRKQGAGLYGPGDITPVVVSMQGLGVLPEIEAKDIPVISVGNGAEVNALLEKEVPNLLVKDVADYEKDYKEFAGTFRRMVGNLEKEPDLEALGMVREPGYEVVVTSPDDNGDDRATRTHKIGYVAYYNKSIMESGKKVPTVMCFHGGGDSAMCMSNLSGWAMVAHDHDFLLISVENHLNSSATETVFMIEQLKKKYPIDEEMIYSTGFSMGGCKSWDMMQEYPKYFAAVAPMDATFEVGSNAWGQPALRLNKETVLPVYYVGGEKTPLPELPFQAQKCVDRMGYVFEVNHVVTKYEVSYEKQEDWKNPIWGIDGDTVVKVPSPERAGSILTLNLFYSENGHCYTVFGCVNDQQHEVRHHTCENAWKFLSQFRRLADGTLVGGEREVIDKLWA